MQRSLLDPVCNVPVSGESRETKGWPPVSLWKLRKEWPIWQYREVSRVYTLTQLLADQQTLRKAPNPWWPLWYHWRPVGWTALRCLATFHTYLRWQIEVSSTNPWFQGSHHFYQWGQWIYAVSSLPERAEMPRGCLFPVLIPTRDVSQRFLIKLTREGSYSLGGFHCLSHKDRNTWGTNYTVHIYFINTWTVEQEVNKGIRCVHL